MTNLKLTAEQKLAMAGIDAFMADPNRQVFNLFGLAGTGKTTLLLHVADQYEHAALCSLTGKAASVLRRRGHDACTLHSWFYRLKRAERDKDGKDKLTWNLRYRNGDLSGELLLLDESSMINEEIGYDLVATGCKIITTGDPGQLQPVKGRRFFDRADFTLTEVHRQAWNSPIIRQAHAVRNGGSYANDGDGFRVSPNAKVEDEDLRNADVVLCWTNPSRNALNRKCRRVRGLWQPHPQAGETIICLKNAAEYNVFNGAIYTLLEPFRQNDTDITIDVDGTPVRIPRVRFLGVSNAMPDDAKLTTWFDYGYAMTVHKSQGSEWPSVVLFDEYCRKDQRAAWLYTAITRASDRIVVA